MVLLLSVGGLAGTAARADDPCGQNVVAAANGGSAIRTNSGQRHGLVRVRRNPIRVARRHRSPPTPRIPGIPSDRAGRIRQTASVSERPPIPATVLGGYLGAGKTTLLNRLLADPGGRRIGVLVNDLGAVSIDAALVRDATDDLVTLANGCVCCTLSDGFAAALDPLRSLPLDAVVVECSGVADPAAVAAHLQTPGFALHGIVVLADAETLITRLADRYVGATVARQLSAADLVVLNKVDLVADTASALAAIERVAPHVPVLATADAAVASEIVLGARHVAGSEGTWVPPEHPTSTTAWTEPLSRATLDAVLDSLATDVVRAKGVIDLTDQPERRTVVQIVGRRRELRPGPAWAHGERRVSTLVVIRAPTQPSG